MKWSGQIRRKLAVLLHRDGFEDDLEEEMKSHLALQAAENEEQGMTAEEAHAAALRQFGQCNFDQADQSRSLGLVSGGASSSGSQLCSAPLQKECRLVGGHGSNACSRGWCNHHDLFDLKRLSASAAAVPGCGAVGYRQPV